MKLSTPVKLTLCVACLVSSVLIVAKTVGLVGDRNNDVVKGRANLCESMAINFSLMAMHNDVVTMEKSLLAVMSRNKDIESIGVRRTSGNLILSSNEHTGAWVPPVDEKSTLTQMIVPISSRGGRWGSLEVGFVKSDLPAWVAWLTSPFMKLAFFMNICSLAVFYLFFVKILRQLNPSKESPVESGRLWIH